MAHLEISCERDRLDRGMILGFLSQTHWAQGLTPTQLDKAIANSLVFGAYRGQRQLGFARIVTDYVSFAYLSDVFVLAEARRLGVGRALMDAALAHPELQQLRRFLLVSRDARLLPPAGLRRTARRRALYGAAPRAGGLAGARLVLVPRK